jgi:hypothetical protein
MAKNRVVHEHFPITAVQQTLQFGVQYVSQNHEVKGKDKKALEFAARCTVRIYVFETVKKKKKSELNLIGYATGFWVSPKHIMTNHHVANDLKLSYYFCELVHAPHESYIKQNMQDLQKCSLLYTINLNDRTTAAYITTEKRQKRDFGIDISILTVDDAKDRQFLVPRYLNFDEIDITPHLKAVGYPTFIKEDQYDTLQYSKTLEYNHYLDIFVNAGKIVCSGTLLYANDNIEEIKKVENTHMHDIFTVAGMSGSPIIQGNVNPTKDYTGTFIAIHSSGDANANFMTSVCLESYSEIYKKYIYSYLEQYLKDLEKKGDMNEITRKQKSFLDEYIKKTCRATVQPATTTSISTTTTTTTVFTSNTTTITTTLQSMVTKYFTYILLISIIICLLWLRC